MQKTPLYKEDLVEILTPLLSNLLDKSSFENALAPIKEDILCLKNDFSAFKVKMEEEIVDIRNEIRSLRLFMDRRFDALVDKFLEIADVQDRHTEEIHVIHQKLSKKIEYEDIPKVKDILYA